MFGKSSAEKNTVAVVGAGVIGLTTAFRLARAGHRVSLHAPNTATGPSWVAGGMFGAYTEAWPGEEAMLHLGAESLRRWLPLLEELEGVPAERSSILTGRGTVLAGVDAADAADVESIVATTEAHYPGVLRHVTRRELRELEPSLAPVLRGAVVCDDEWSLDNRLLLSKLGGACRDLGVERTHGAVADVDELRETTGADVVVVAAGAASGELLDLPIREVKGEVLRVRARDSSESGPDRTVRARVHGRPCYLVPRSWGLAIGATEYEHGHDLEPTAGGARTLLDDAALVFPGVDDYSFAEVSAGLRPYSPDNVPMIGEVRDGVVAACGHGRNGILLAAVTADAIAAMVAGDPLSEAAAADPRRFRRNA
ncbi:glycine oxidase ThiO [uncultured Corynebacterium sp.]|uniref:glycine oxidase ThiO n=1 Tax=uncultured Corynebacterium sp. TaxID=159447 RepID=UPI0025D41BEF|nr:glycine oxidase ThiO [uncultured Corynebacterium sp.]